MAHELTMRSDGTAECAYYGELPWHGLGTRMIEGATEAEWIEAAGMNWEIAQSRVVYRAHSDNEMRVMEDRLVNHRSDTGAPLGIVSSGFQNVQPAQTWEFFRNVMASLNLTFDCAGTLFGGRKFWVSAKIGEHEIGRDIIKGYLLLSTACDGTMRTTGKITTVKTVCNNTLTAALRGSGKEVKVSHRTSFDINSAQDALGLNPQRFEDFIQQMRALADVRLSGDMAETLTEKLVGNDAKATKNIARLFLGEAIGYDSDPAMRGTVWSYLNSVTEYIDHGKRAKSDSHRLNNNLFGVGDALKEKALELACEYAGVAI
jgi:phage/plasmid-like protein (TIGR03299 family)